jgi:hypothetical protein|tara:strand:+ start:868 stop:2307 length:1440 start_codon:yes stop_codon:yes gene_type:complete
MYASTDDWRGDTIIHAASNDGKDQPLMDSGATPRSGIFGKTGSEMRSTTRSTVWGITIFLGLVSAALLGVATLFPTLVFSTLSAPNTGSLECGATNLECWKREARKVGGLKNEVSSWQRKATSLQNTVRDLHATITESRNQIDARVTRINARMGNLKTAGDLSDDGAIPWAIKKAVADVVDAADALRSGGGDVVPLLGQNDPPKVVFHAHIAKTAGSTFNRFVARRYHASCGNKGVSFAQSFKDDADANDAADADDHLLTRNAVFGFLNQPSLVTGDAHVTESDMFSSWGWHNCALISLEITKDEWADVTDRPSLAGQTKAVMIPCRDPIDHILSQCNYNHQSFTDIISGEGGEQACADALPQCHVGWERYEHSMLEKFDKVVLFKYDDFEGVERYLDDALPKRRLELEHATEFGFYATNTERSTTNERFTDACPEETLRKNLLEKWSYYRLCDKFLGDSTWQEFDSRDLRDMIEEQHV